MITHFKWLILIWNLATPASERLYKTAKSNLGKDVAPLENEYGCAEAVNNIVHYAFGDYAGGDLSTYRMFHAIRVNKKFIKVSKPIRGDIILSPTGYGAAEIISNGHVGIVSDDSKIMSNTSTNGLWLENYTLDSWKQRYKEKGRYPIYYFRRLTL